MISLCSGLSPKRKAQGVFEVIQYLRELAEIPEDDNFESLPETIPIEAFHIAIPDLSFWHEVCGSEANPISLKIVDRDERNPKVMLVFGPFENVGISENEFKTVLTVNPFRDIKRIEEYDTVFEGELNTLIKVCLEKMSVTFLK